MILASSMVLNLFPLSPLSSDVEHVKQDVFVFKLDLGDRRRLNSRVEDVLKFEIGKTLLG